MTKFHTVVGQLHLSNITPSKGNTFIPPTMTGANSVLGTLASRKGVLLAQSHSQEDKNIQ